ncbi:hypothetical protein C5167_015205 [Papaver somniferum]|uniref:Uncharacterized protein n=1 Tax=Papaver somniferum TaxID=3469 RepID=A0A4Y7J8H5_PAPSO|nr:hypothetical protein C5167_015205 [Papaver somniferum]
MIIPLPPPYDPHGGYPVPPLAMTAPSPLPPHDGMMAKNTNFGEKALEPQVLFFLHSFKEQLQQRVRVHAVACWQLEQSLQSLTETKPNQLLYLLDINDYVPVLVLK